MKAFHIIFIGAILSLVGSVVPYSWSFYLDLTLIRVNLISIVGGLITCFGILKHNSGSSKKSSHILERTLETLGQIQSLNTKLQETELEIRGLTTGGNSYCVVELFRKNKLFPSFMVRNAGLFPLYDVNVRLLTLDSDGQLNLDELSLRMQTFHIGNLPVGQGLPIHGTIKLDSYYNQYNVFVNARNGSTSQTIKAMCVNGDWFTSVQVTREDTSEILYQKTDDSFIAPNNE